MAWPSYTQTFHSKSYPSILPSRPEISAKDKVVLITGSGSGIGQATAIAFAQAGAKTLILCGRRTNTLSETKSKIDALNNGTQVLVEQLDVSDETSVNSTFETVKNNVGEIDIVINSAGYLADTGNLKDSTTSNFWTSFEVNVKGPFLIARAFLKHTTPSISKPRTLVLLSSFLACLPATRVSTAAPSYCISKLAQVKYAEFIAAQNPFSSTGFRAYALHPGVVETEMSSRSISSAPDPEALKKILTFDEPELPAGFMLWLCSKRGECVPSGRFLWINWDVDELESKADEIKESEDLFTIGMMGWPFK